MTSQTVPILKAYASKTAPYCRTHPNVGSLGASLALLDCRTPFSLSVLHRLVRFSLQS
jgi:hypothetical protein